MNFKEFQDYIYQRHSGNVKLGLDRMINILKEMGSPELKLKGFHVAGTNGKGSTSAMCEQICRAYDKTVGLNTSPHLVDYRERIRINEKNITFEELLRIYKLWESTFEENEASFFEITTAMAFYYFLEQKVDVAIMEVGLGGRLDGTNPYHPTVSAITTISYDHPKSLGDSIEKIAFEKAGIIKSGIPVVVGKMSKNAEEVILDQASKKSSETIVYGQDFYVDNIHLSKNGTIFNYYYPAENIEYKNISTNLLGEHQAYNASVAITSFIQYCKINQLEISENKIREGLNKVNWAGRMQILSHEPTVILDGAHNDQSVDLLVKNMKSIFPKEKIKSVIAILRDKNIESMITNICSISDKIYISKNNSNRAAEIDDQVAVAKRSSIPYEAFDNVKEALLSAVKESSANDVIIISGSLYTVSEILALQPSEWS